MPHPDWMGSCQKKTRVCTDGNEREELQRTMPPAMVSRGILSKPAVDP